MEKLTLEHLAPYLPYSMKGLQESTNLIWWLYKESNICRQEDNYHSISINDFIIYELKPILRPLSDLTNEKLKETILKTQNEWNEHIFSISEFRRIEIVDNLPYLTFILLVKNHFDVFGLIDKGLAIDINTLK